MWLSGRRVDKLTNDGRTESTASDVSLGRKSKSPEKILGALSRRRPFPVCPASRGRVTGRPFCTEGPWRSSLARSTAVAPRPVPLFRFVVATAGRRSWSPAPVPRSMPVSSSRSPLCDLESPPAYLNATYWRESMALQDQPLERKTRFANGRLFLRRMLGQFSLQRAAV